MSWGSFEDIMGMMKEAQDLEKKYKAKKPEEKTAIDVLQDLQNIFKQNKLK